MKLNTTESEAEAKAFAVSLSAETLQASRDINVTLTACETVKPHVMTLYVNPALNLQGIADLIAYILTEREAIFPAGIELTELRAVVIAGSLFRSQIEREIQNAFTSGTTRYPLQTVKNFLGVYGKGIIGKIQLSSAEDTGRPCKRPRCKYFLIAL